MRTTVTIEPDTEALLKQEARRTGESFKRVLNRAVQQALGAKSSARVQVPTLFSAPFPPEIEGVNFNRWADELDDTATVRELSS